MSSHLSDDLCEATAGLVTDPHFVLGAESSTDGLQLGVDGFIREGLDAHVGLAGRVQLQVVSQCRVRKSLQVHKQPKKRVGPSLRKTIKNFSVSGFLQTGPKKENRK